MICENLLCLSWIISQLFFLLFVLCLFVCLLVGWLVGWLVDDDNDDRHNIVTNHGDKTRATGGPPAVLAPESVAHYTVGPATGGDRTG